MSLNFQDMIEKRMDEFHLKALFTACELGLTVILKALKVIATRSY